jgi:hypothetical protein
MSSNNFQMREYCINYCKILNTVIKEAKRQHYCRLIAKSDNQTKRTWNVVKHETWKLHLTEQIQSLLRNNEKVKDPEVVVIITENINLHEKMRGYAISLLNKAFSRKFPGIKTISITETEIKSILKAKKKSFVLR